MRIPKRSLGTLVFAAGTSITSLSHAAPIRIIPDPLLPAGHTDADARQRERAGGHHADPPQPGSLCVCISRDSLPPLDSACTSAPISVGSPADSAESRAWRRPFSTGRTDPPSNP